MSRANELLEQATPLPWWSLWPTEDIVSGPDGDEIARVRGNMALGPFDAKDNAALIVYAVNHLSDHLAAVEALRALTDFWDDPDGYPAKVNREHWEILWGEARAALARLRDEVTA